MSTRSGEEVLGLLTSFGPLPHSGHNPGLAADLLSTQPFEAGRWYDPKWGSRISGTLVNDFCICLEEATRALGGYISLRLGEVPPYSYKIFFINKFGWIRDYFSSVLEVGGGSPDTFLSSYSNRVLIGPLGEAELNVIRWWKT